MRAFTYDATDSRGRRRAPRIDLSSPDAMLTPTRRRSLIGTTRDLTRNMAIAAWMVRKHLDYVSTFRFQAKTGNPDLDDQLEKFVRWWEKPANFDSAARHSRQRLIRLIEERRTVDGDAFIVKLKDGRIQVIEGDRVRTPNRNLPANFDASAYTHGVQVDALGRAVNYIVCDRMGAGFAYAQTLNASHVLQHAFFDRVDQVRGVSPLAAAVNTFQDIHENAEYALAKAKVSQLFGLKFVRKSEVSLPNNGDNEETDTDVPPYQFDFGAGPQVLDLEEGDDASIIESATPSTQFQSFMEQMVSAALKSLDIPYSFYDESHTNYSGSRGALLQYDRSAETKRGDVQLVLDDLTAWRFGLAVDDGQLQLPAGVSVADLRWEWVHHGTPWLDPLKEVKADVEAVNARVRSRQQICKARGSDFFEVVDQQAEEEAYIRSKGLAVLPTTGVPTTPPKPQEDEDEDE